MNLIQLQFPKAEIRFSNIAISVYSIWNKIHNRYSRLVFVYFSTNKYQTKISPGEGIVNLVDIYISTKLVPKREKKEIYV